MGYNISRLIATYVHTTIVHILTTSIPCDRLTCCVAANNDPMTWKKFINKKYIQKYCNKYAASGV